MAKLSISPEAEQDTTELATRLGLRDKALARRLPRLLWAAARKVARTPTMGTPILVDHPAYREARIVDVVGAPSAMLVYRPTSTGIDVVRVLSSGSALAGWLVESTGNDNG